MNGFLPKRNFERLLVREIISNFGSEAVEHLAEDWLLSHSDRPAEAETNPLETHIETTGIIRHILKNVTHFQILKSVIQSFSVGQ